MANDRHTMFFMGKEYPNVAMGGGSGGGGSFDVTDLFVNEQHSDLTQITLSESIENYDLIEFIVEDRTYQNYTSFVYDSEWMVNNVPYVSDNPTGNFPHIFLLGYDNHFLRATMGQTNDKLIIPTDKNSLMIYAIRGLKSGSGGGGGNISIEYKDYANFVAQGRIILPFKVNSDYKITATFQAPTYKNDNSIFGNTANSNLAHCTIYNSRYYVSTGNGETNFEKELYGKHTVTMNDGGYTTFDGDNTTNFTPTTDDNVSLVLAGRNGDGQNYSGKLYEFIIESISTGEELFHVKPAVVKANGIIIAKGLLDSVSGEIYTANGMSLGND